MLRFLQKRAYNNAMVKTKGTKRRRILPLLLWLMFFGISFYGYYLWQRSTNDALTTINIGGDYQHINSEQIRAIVLPYTKVGFFKVNINNLKNQLEQIPWVANVEVQKVWPQTLDITITEQKPFAKWNNTSLVNLQGEVFSPAIDTFPTGLPRFYGPIGEQKILLDYYQRMNELLAPLHLQVMILQVTPRMAWGITLSNGVKVILGRDKVLPRVERLVTMYPKIVGANSNLVNDIDMRYLNGIAISWKNMAANQVTSNQQIAQSTQN